MAHPTLEDRVSKLESLVQRLTAGGEVSEAPNAGNRWLSTVGMFAGDDVMKEVIEEGRRIREEDREQAR